MTFQPMHSVLGCLIMCLAIDCFPNVVKTIYLFSLHLDQGLKPPFSTSEDFRAKRLFPRSWLKRMEPQQQPDIYYIPILHPDSNLIRT